MSVLKKPFLKEKEHERKDAPVGGLILLPLSGTEGCKDFVPITMKVVIVMMMMLTVIFAGEEEMDGCQ